MDYMGILPTGHHHQTDNAKQFTSKELEEYCLSNNIERESTVYKTNHC